MRPIRVIVALTLLLAGAPSGWAASPCPISLQEGTAIAVDGVLGSEWDDAALIASAGPAASPCLPLLLDGDGTFRPVTIRSKRYLSAGNPMLGIFFEVGDTSTQQDGGAALLNGESVILQLDPDTGTPTATKYRIRIGHKWASADGDPGLVVQTEASPRFFASSSATTICASQGAAFGWTPNPGAGLAAVVRKDQLTAGYTVELAVPLSLIGNPGGDIGVAIGIVNDFGACMQPGGVCDGHGIGFPADLPMTNTDNPVSGCGVSWRRPDEWATGFVDRAPADVFISRQPRSWTSEDVNALACGTVDNAYYPANPCRLSVRTRVRSTSPGEQTRNLLILRGDHGAGVVEWRFVDLIEGLSVPAGSSTTRDSAEVSYRSGSGAHPCVRSLLLPPSIDPDFDLTAMRGIAGAADLARLVDVYGLRLQHYAQQNISRRSESAGCPHAGCGIGAHWLERSRRIADGAGRVLTDALGRAAQAADTHLAAGTAARHDGPPRLFQVPPPRGDRSPAKISPILTGLGTAMALPEAAAAFGKDHLAVETVALGYREPPTDVGPLPSPRINFIEVVGGAVDLVPMRALAAGAAIPIRLSVGNPVAVPRWIGLSIRVRDPADTGAVIALADGLDALAEGPLKPMAQLPIELLAGARGAVEAALDEAGAGQPPPPPEGTVRHWGFLIILLFLALLVFFGRSRP
jgi:hypothetical protein